MRLPRSIWPKRRRNIVLTALGVVLLAALVAVFHPRLQTHVLREQMVGVLDEFEVTRVHVLPWSVQVSGLDLAQDGLRLGLASAKVNFSPWRLLLDVVKLDEVTVTGLRVDLREVPPSASASGPFPGLFAMLNQGYALDLRAIAIDGGVALDDDLSLRLSVSGGGLAPQASGTLDLDLVVSRASDKARFELAGPLLISQDEDGRIVGLGADFLALAAAPELAEEEVVAIVIEADPVTTAVLDENGTTIGTRFSGDHFKLNLRKPGADADLFTLVTDGTLDVDKQELAIDYEITAGDPLITAYAPSAELPEFLETASGKFLLELASLQATLDYQAEMSVKSLDLVLGDNPDLPDGLSFGQRFRVRFGGERATIDELSLELRPQNGEAVFSFELNEALTVVYEQATALLDNDALLATLAVHDLPASWFNGLLAEPALRGGTIAGAFELRSVGGALVLKPVGQFGLDGATLDDRLNVPAVVRLHTSPTLRYLPDKVTFAAPHTVLEVGGVELATLDLDLSLALEGDAVATPAVGVTGSFDVNRIAALPLFSASLTGYELPPDLRADLAARLAVTKGRIRIRKFSAAVRQNDAPALLSAEALQPFSIMLGADSPSMRNPDGELALLVVDNLDLAWVDPFVPGFSLSGTLDAATFALSAGADNDLAVRSRQAVKLHGVVLADDNGTLIENLALSVRPEVDYTPARTNIRYRELEARIGDAELLAGSGALGVAMGDPDKPAHFTGDGALTLALRTLTKIPALAPALSKLKPSRDWQLGLDYDLSGNAARIELSNLNLDITVDDQSRLRISNDSTLVLRPSLGPGEDLAQHLTGAARAEITDLSSALLSDLLPLGGFSFDALTAEARIDSDGSVLSAEMSKPFNLSGARVGGDAPLLESFSLTAAATVRAVGQQIEADLQSVQLVFAAMPAQPAIGGTLTFALLPAHTIPLRRLTAQLTGALPPLLKQPVAMPGHKLTSGMFTLDVSVDESGAIESAAVLDGLVAGEPLAIQRMEAHAKGTMAADGRGFGFEMPLSGDGRSGRTDGLLIATYAPGEKKKSRLKLKFDSEKFLLNDVLATLESIAADAPKTAARKPTPDAPNTPAGELSAAALEPDTTAVWDVLPYDTVVKYHIKDLYYTDYVIFNDVAGEVVLTAERFTLRSLAARFHDSPIKLDGKLNFVADNPKPYDLKLNGTVTEFDLNQFFTELVPGTKPRVEGLFSVNFDGYGVSPNIAQYRNELLFDMKLKSRAGVFRPLPPDGGLMTDASDILGLVGEGLSYVPTGGFGAGAVSRLVNYIALIDYDRIDIDIVRDDSRDIVIRQFLVQSPTVNLTATGGIDYVDGKDILDSPLTLDAHLNMSGKGAAILYSMDLLEDEKDAYGYNLGPSFHIRGTPAAAESNFAEVVSAAADGTVKGAITRPISGLIGNIMYRWFGDDPLPYDEADGEGAPVGESDAQEAQAPAGGTRQLR